MSTWKKVGPQAGSNPGGVYQDQNGTPHYVKYPLVDEEQAIAEKISDDIYRALVIPVKKSHLVQNNGQLGLASDMLPGAKRLSEQQLNGHRDIKSGYLADAYLANWDVFGLDYDNVMEGPEGRAYRIDNGGTLFFRAQGTPKDFPSDKVAELESLIEPGRKGHAAYGNLPPEEIVRQAKALVTTLTDGQLKSIVAEAGLAPEWAQQYLAALTGRREVIRRRFLI